MLISDLKDKKILILGFGREGQDSFLFLRKKFPDKMIGIADKLEYDELPLETQKLLKNDKRVVFYLNSDYLKAIKKYELIIKTPGIPLQNLKPFLSKNQIVTSQTNIFFANCPGMIIGVTGTKGKSTASSLIYAVLKSGGMQAHLIGNIEKPVLQFLFKANKEDVFVYELSSFQLQMLKQSPHIAVFLNLYPEHLDHHGDFQSYALAKANIAKFQTADDYLIYNENDENVQRLAARTKAKKLPFRYTSKKNALFVTSPQPAILIGKLFHISKTKIDKAIDQFQPLPHRLERIGKYKDITFYNDSLATIPEASIAAIESLGKDVATIVLGGFDRGVGFESLAEKLLKSDLNTLILFPTTGEKIWKEIEKQAQKHHRRKTPRHFFVNNMATAVDLCYEHTPKGKICLLSPASSSFNLFENYKQRGEEFKKFVVSYGKKKIS